MAHITVAGVGPGSEKYLTRACIEAAEQADILVGGRRQLALFSHLTSEKYVITAAMDKLIDYLADNARAGKKIVVLASGDPGFYGIQSTLQNRLPGFTINVLPGVSSIQLACARLGLPWHDVFLTSCHGRDYGHLARAVKDHHKVITLTDPRHNPAELARILLNKGVTARKVYVACNLSYPDELITATTLEQLAAVPKWRENNCVMVIINE
ncbi:precorrin-6y C5,15-methyltransferase (decarboxylating) subunit CbiE [Desulfoscipio gibsoniae]|uniref:Precorrin-6y C5,15-methyltransferase (Decarboxylating), CbiE subunit n=1 Tax=Desulfoscipio gibsoniae DSM 7213 TaxID=767817 RepID=R4KFT5_9FIRM|nr:precorrin-6y C5,15-methyltransferase (decarboxylating) subunit CbiE [Desulfoscipio gibsoniae]AGL01469.1 precorrin-6y C5,15-methyltransferase (decarboxylating), CbiE subunit [Desulfoscipio gibsoniae DSM 7213]